MVSFFERGRGYVPRQTVSKYTSQVEKKYSKERPLVAPTPTSPNNPMDDMNVLVTLLSNTRIWILIHFVVFRNQTNATDFLCKRNRHEADTLFFYTSIFHYFLYAYLIFTIVS